MPTFWIAVLYYRYQSFSQLFLSFLMFLPVNVHFHLMLGNARHTTHLANDSLGRFIIFLLGCQFGSVTCAVFVKTLSESITENGFLFFIGANT